MEIVRQDSQFGHAEKRTRPMSDPLVGSFVFQNLVVLAGRKGLYKTQWIGLWRVDRPVGFLESGPREAILVNCFGRISFSRDFATFSFALLPQLSSQLWSVPTLTVCWVSGSSTGGQARMSRLRIRIAGIPRAQRLRRHVPSVRNR